MVVARSIKRTIELGRKNAEQVRNVLEQNPDLPVIMITENGPDNYAWYYHEGVEASVDWLLFGEFCEDVPGVQFDKIYNDEDEVANDIAISLFDSWLDALDDWLLPIEKAFLDTHELESDEEIDEKLHEFTEATLNESGWSTDNYMEVLEELADEFSAFFTKSLPWSKWVVIRAWL